MFAYKQIKKNASMNLPELKQVSPQNLAPSHVYDLSEQIFAQISKFAAADEAKYQSKFTTWKANAGKIKPGHVIILARHLAKLCKKAKKVSLSR